MLGAVPTQECSSGLKRLKETGQINPILDPRLDLGFGWGRRRVQECRRKVCILTKLYRDSILK